MMNQDNLVDVMTRLQAGWLWNHFWVLARARDFSFHHSIHFGSWLHPASYPTATGICLWR